MAGWLRTVMFGLVMLALASSCGDGGDGEDGYGPDLRDDFVSECEDKGTSEPVCVCLYESLEATLPYERFEAVDAALRDGASAIPPDVEAVAVACAADPDRDREADPATSRSDG